MIQSSDMLEQLSLMEKRVYASKWKRVIHRPFNYLIGIFFRKIIYPLFQKKAIVHTHLFWGEKIKIALPASMDMYLVGGKSDDSEIRLTKFIIRTINPGDDFFDIGAHVGYYSLLAARLTGEEGTIVCVEPSPAINSILNSNISRNKKINAIHAAVLEKEGDIDFFQFPVIHSEHNTIDTRQYNRERWYQSVKAKKITVKGVSGDSIISQFQLRPGIIKIDVEGAENRVVEGLKDYLAQHNPYVVMEFLCTKRNNMAHRQADTILREVGYLPYLINGDGELIILNNLPADYIDTLGIESDNIIYYKRNPGALT